MATPEKGVFLLPNYLLSQMVFKVKVMADFYLFKQYFYKLKQKNTFRNIIFIINQISLYVNTDKKRSLFRLLFVWVV
jgi:hypothetical protein